MSDTNRVAIRATKESSLGVAPTSPNLQELSITGAPNLAFSPETVVSEQIRSDRQIDDLVLVGGESAGDINAEHAFEVHDLLLEGAWFNLFQVRYTRSNDVTASQIVSVDGTLETVTVTDEGDQPVAGDIIRHEGFGVSQNNGYFTVASSSGNTDYVVNEDLADESTVPEGASSHVVGRRAATGDIVATTSPDGLTSTVLDFTTLGLQDGDWLKLSGSGGTWPTANNDWVRIQKDGISANALLFDIVPSGWAADPGTGATVDLYLGERLVNGVERQSYFLEEEFSDHSPVTYQYFLGMVVDAFTLTAPAQSIATITFTFSGLQADYSDANVQTDLFPTDASGRIAGATTVPLGPVNVLNTSSNVGRLARGGTPIAGKNFVLEATIEIANNLRQQPAVGNLGAVGIGVGEFGLTGNLNTYFDSAELARDVVNNTETSLDVRLEDSAEHAIVIDSPRLKFSEGAPEVPGKNQDVTINLAYQAIRSPDFNYTNKYMRFWGFN